MPQQYDDLFKRPGISPSSLGDLARAMPSTLNPTWPIANLLPAGLTLVTGDSYSGKTSLALHLAYSLATGTAPFSSSGETANHFSIPRFRVLYIALDSSTLSLHQLQSRLPAPPDYDPEARYLSLVNIWNPLTPDEGLQELHNYFSIYGDLRLVVLDNLAALRPLFKGTDRELLAILRRLAELHNVSILVLHTCKRPTPLVTCADHHMHVKRSPISSYYHLDIVGKFLQPTTHLLHCPADLIAFRLVTIHESLALNTVSAHKVLTTERLVILRLLHDCSQNLTPKQISALLDLDYDCVRQLLSKMVKANLLLVTVRGHYTLHPFIKALIPALLDQYPLLPNFATAHIPPDDLDDDSTPPETPIAHNLSPSVTSDNPPALPKTATAHNSALPQTVPNSSSQPKTPIAHNPKYPASNPLESTISHNPSNLSQPINLPETGIAHNVSPHPTPGNHHPTHNPSPQNGGTL